METPQAMMDEAATVKLKLVGSEMKSQVFEQLSEVIALLEVQKHVMMEILIQMMAVTLTV